MKLTPSVRKWISLHTNLHPHTSSRSSPPFWTQPSSHLPEDRQAENCSSSSPPSSYWYRAFPTPNTPSEAAKLRGVPCLYVKKAGASDSESLRHLLIPNDSRPFLLSDLHVLPQIALLRHICDSGAGFASNPAARKIILPTPRTHWFHAATK